MPSPDFQVCVILFTLKGVAYHHFCFYFCFFSHELDIDENPDSEVDDNGFLLGFNHGSGQK